MKNIFLEPLSHAELSHVTGGRNYYFDSTKGLYVNGMLVDSWRFKLALLGYDVSRPEIIENDLDEIVIKINELDSINS